MVVRWAGELANRPPVTGLPPHDGAPPEPEPEREPRPLYDTATGRRITGYDPYTGEPILAAPSGTGNPQWLVNLQERWRGLSARAKILILAGGALGVVVLVSVLASSAPSSSGTTSGGGSSSAEAGSSVGVHLTGTVRGHMHSADFTLQLNGTDMTAFHKVRFTNVYCGWDGSHVTVHLTVHNDLPTNTVQVNNVTVDVSPAYAISGGGSHGDSANSDQTLTVPAGRQITWWLNAGSPQGSRLAARSKPAAPTWSR